jgi:hypothetical protein
VAKKNFPSDDGDSQQVIGREGAGSDFVIKLAWFPLACVDSVSPDINSSVRLLFVPNQPC